MSHIKWECKLNRTRYKKDKKTGKIIETEITFLRSFRIFKFEHHKESIIYECDRIDKIFNERRQWNLGAARCLDENLHLLGLYKIPLDLVMDLLPRCKYECFKGDIYPAWRDMDIQLVEDEDGNWSYRSMLDDDLPHGILQH